MPDKPWTFDEWIANVRGDSEYSLPDNTDLQDDYDYYARPPGPGGGRYVSADEFANENEDILDRRDRLAQIFRDRERARLLAARDRMVKARADERKPMLEANTDLQDDYDYYARPRFDVNIGPAQIQPEFDVSVGPAQIEPDAPRHTLTSTRGMVAPPEPPRLPELGRGEYYNVYGKPGSPIPSQDDVDLARSRLHDKYTRALEAEDKKVMQEVSGKMQVLDQLEQELFGWGSPVTTPEGRRSHAPGHPPRKVEFEEFRNRLGDEYLMKEDVAPQEDILKAPRALPLEKGVLL